MFSIGDRYRLVSPKWSDKAGNARGGKTYETSLAAILPANTAIPKALIERYYGAGAPAGVFKPCRFDRLCLRDVASPAHYIIVPDTPYNRRFLNTISNTGDN